MCQLGLAWGQDLLLPLERPGTRAPPQCWPCWELSILCPHQLSPMMGANSPSARVSMVPVGSCPPPPTGCAPSERGKAPFYFLVVSATSYRWGNRQTARPSCESLGPSARKTSSAQIRTSFLKETGSWHVFGAWWGHGRTPGSPPTPTQLLTVAQALLQDESGTSRLYRVLPHLGTHQIESDHLVAGTQGGH